jgi:hypothetical protein
MAFRGHRQRQDLLQPVALYSRGPASGWAWTQGAIPHVDRHSGAVYVTWEATGAGPDGGEKTSAVPAVKFMRSTEEGRTWSAPVVINDVQPKRTWACCTFEPNMGVAPNGRSVAVPREDIYFTQARFSNSLIPATSTTTNQRTAPTPRVLYEGSGWKVPPLVVQGGFAVV